jgi:AraC-like DNA-binding protein
MLRKFTKLFPDTTYLDLFIVQFGYEECDPMHVFGPAARNHFLFHYVLSGKGILYSDDDRNKTMEYNLEGEQGFMIWPGQRNTYKADESDPWTYMWVEFDGLKAKELVKQSALTFNRPVYSTRNPEEHERMKKELQYIVDHDNSPPIELMGHFYLFINALIGSSAPGVRTSGGGLQFFYVNEAMKYVEQHYQDDITVEDIAAYCNLNRSYLGKVFRTVLKTNLQDFLIRYRINRACELMKISKQPIGEICVMVGYPNLFNFSRAFKRITGQSPSEWRKENKLL